jgi:hypothetical protein
MKTCNKCKTQKEVSEFYKSKANNDGRQYRCKSCEKQCKEENSEKIKEKAKQYYQDNSEKIIQYKKDNKEKISKYQKQYQKQYENKNKEKISKYQKQYQKQYQKDNKDKRKQYKNNRYQNDPAYRLTRIQRSAIYSALKAQSTTKSQHTHELLGCTSKEVKQHIENQFEYWMDWDNQGNYNGEYFIGWDVDHIRPISSFDLSDPEEQKIAFSYKNLMPLCSRTNRDDKRDILFSDWIEDQPFYFLFHLNDAIYLI